MSPTEHDMPVIEATFTGDAWIVALPGGREAVCSTQEAVERLVRAAVAGNPMTPVAERKLALYREEHRIRPVKDFDDDIRRGFVWRCDFDHIRIHPMRNDRWRHDMSEIKALVRGEVAW